MVDVCIRPWEWINDSESRQNKKISIATQTNCYTAFFESVWKKDWFAGVHFWSWTDHVNAGGIMVDKIFGTALYDLSLIQSAWDTLVLILCVGVTKQKLKSLSHQPMVAVGHNHRKNCKQNSPLWNES